MAEDHIAKPTDPDALILEAWGQGLMVGSLVVMAAITMANMKSHILLHKLIFAEVGGSEIHPRIFLNSPELLLMFRLVVACPRNGPWYFHLSP